MATPSKRSTARGAVKAPENLLPSEVVAQETIASFSDLTPSVQRIMQADLSETQRYRAITAFRASLDVIGDPNRDPRYAVANCGPDDPS